ncbi:hypothetical protein [Streptomyces longisporus]|uniref:Uncharacterized protein n=1 Tax=Streptomyces longisporus TaxID=1948 RepID=A0ABN3LWR5_STRLO
MADVSLTRPVGTSACTPTTDWRAGTASHPFPRCGWPVRSRWGTHLVLDAEPAGCRTGEVTLVGYLSPSCGPAQLVLSDREFLSVPLWRAFTATAPTARAPTPSAMVRLVSDCLGLVFTER